MSNHSPDHPFQPCGNHTPRGSDQRTPTAAEGTSETSSCADRPDGPVADLPGAGEVVLAGDVEGYRTLLARLQQSAAPSSGENLLGMQVDVEHYLGPDGPLRPDHLDVTAFCGGSRDAAGVVRACGTWVQALPAAADRRQMLRERARRLSLAWTTELAYRHAQAHVVTAAFGGSLFLRGVTQIGPGEFFVTVLLDARSTSPD